MLFFFLWADGSFLPSIGGGWKFHRDIMVIASLEPGTYRLRASYVTIGWYPQWDCKSLGLSQAEWESDE